MQRFFRNRSGEDIATIAKNDKVSEKTVAESIRICEAYRTLSSAESINHSLGALVAEVLPEAQAAIKEALVATDQIEVEKDGKKELRTVADHGTRLRAFDRVVETARVIQPKVPSHPMHLQVGVGINPGRQASGSYLGMEDRMREIRTNLQTQPQLPAAEVEGEYIEAGDDAVGEGSSA